MTRVAWVMRPAAKIETPEVKGGHLAVVTLKCGHVITWKLSRLKTYKPDRWRCVECHELLEEFLSAETCGAFVQRLALEGFEHDKRGSERAARRADAGRSSHLLGGMGPTVQRRFMRGD